MSGALLDVRDMRLAFRTPSGPLQALAGVDLAINAGETLALVGESGSGKSTLALAILGMHRAAGEVRFQGEDLSRLRGAQLKAARRAIGMVFQNPYASLDPRWTIGAIIAEPLRAQGLLGRDGGRAQIAAALESVGLPADAASRRPRQFSGGQRQRIAIARALALEPKLLILDEPVSALDVSIQEQIIALLQEIKARTGVAYLLIAHDLALVQNVADRIAVMYLGRIVETGNAASVIARPQHPYTAALVSAAPTVERALARAAPRLILQGEPASALSVPDGCPFHPRCPLVLDRCMTDRPKLGPGAAAACHFPGVLKLS